MIEVRKNSDGQVLGPRTERRSYDEQQMGPAREPQPFSVYYQDEAVTLYHGDCRDVLPTIERCDLLLTDPPYGIGADKGQAGRANRRDGRAVTASRDYGITDWDATPVDQSVLAAAMASATSQIIFGGNYFNLPPSSCWLVWDKDNGSNDYADCELAWTNLRKPVRKIVHRWHGMRQQPGCEREHREHPTQKPEPVMRWALMQAPDSVRTVLDPFAGSGTTGVAAKRLGRRCILIEQNEQYCAVAARRLSQSALDLYPVEPKAVQGGLL